MKKTILIFLCLLIFIAVVKPKEKEKEVVQIPENLKIIAFTGTEGYVNISAIDLDNNELIIIVVNPAFETIRVIRTGAVVNPKDYNKLSMTDAPFGKEKL